MTPPPSADSTRTVIERFNEAFNGHDADALALVLTDDTLFEDTSAAARRPADRRQGRSGRILAGMVRA